MFVVISSPVPLPDEAMHINNMFDMGLICLHLRRPGSVAADLSALLKGISNVHWHKIAWHQHHDLALTTDSKRLHYTTLQRQQTDQKELEQLAAQGCILSTSVHSMQEYEQLPDLFAYVFIGPVFDSISKPDYKAVMLAQRVYKGNCRLMALGGIHADNCGDALLASYDGIAISGAIWQQEQPVQAFKTIKDKWSTTDRSY